MFDNWLISGVGNTEMLNVSFKPIQVMLLFSYVGTTVIMVDCVLFKLLDAIKPGIKFWPDCWVIPKRELEEFLI